MVGGTAAISDAVTAELRALGIKVERVSGPERAATATAIAARRGVGSRGAILVEGHTPVAWAPGLAAAALAARDGAAVVLSNRDTLPGATTAWLGRSRPKILVCGPFVRHDACSHADEARGAKDA